MGKIVDPSLDFFIQIPLAEKNILQAFIQNGFQVSSVQKPSGETQNIIFHNTQYPKKTVQFDPTTEGVENFLYTYQKNYFIVLSEFEMTFIIHTPTGEEGIAIRTQNNEERYPTRKVNYSGEGLREIAMQAENGGINLKKNNELFLEQTNIQVIFDTFVREKKLIDIEKI